MAVITPLVNRDEKIHRELGVELLEVFIEKITRDQQSTAEGATTYGLVHLCQPDTWSQYSIRTF